MANPWFRLWGDMVNDPKWRTIAKKSDQRIGDVIAVALHMMTLASNATERGCIEGWNDEDIGTALEIKTEQVEAIRIAMQGRVLDGDYLTGWEKRQPKREREDGPSTPRVQAFRDRKNHETPCNAKENHETPREEEIREEEIKIKAKSKTEASPRGSRLSSDWQAPDEFIEFCKNNRPDMNPRDLIDKFRDYWSAIPGSKGLKTDWLATWRNFVKSERAPQQPRASPAAKFDPLAYVNRNRIQNHERTIDLDATGEPILEMVRATSGTR